MARRTATRYIPVSPTLLSPRMLWAQLSAKAWTLWGNYVECAVRLAPLNRERQRAHNHQRACGRASWTSDRPLVDQGHSTSARTAICDDQNLVLVTLASARCRLAVGAHDSHRAFTGR